MNTALDDLQAVIFKWKDNTSVIKPKLDCRGTGAGVRWWRVQLVDETDTDHTWVNTKLDDCADWVGEILKDWSNVKRMSFDIWDFKHRQDAEKFLTVFHLSWDQ